MKRLQTQTDAIAPVLAGTDETPTVNAVIAPTVANYGQTGVPTGKTASRPRLLARRMSRMERRAAH